MDEILIKAKAKIKPQWKYAFMGCVIAGLLMHMYPMTHHFLTYDSLWNQYSNQDMITSGRQFLMYACGISSYYDLPWVNGILAIFYLALASVAVVEAFEMKGKWFSAFTGVLMVTFPSLVSTFCYAYTIDGYMLAVLLAALAYLVTRKYKWGFLAGIVLMGVSLGIYQAYYSFTILLCILGLLKDICTEEKIKQLLLKSLRYLAMGIGGYVFYVVTLKIMLVLKAAEISGYQGTDRILSVALTEIPRGIYMAFRMFGSFALRSNVLTNNRFMVLALGVLVGCALWIYALLFKKSNAYKCVWKVLAALLLVLMIPLGSTLISVLSPDAFFHLLMRYPWVLFFVFALVITDDLTERYGKKSTNVFGITVSLAAIVMVFNFMVQGNIAYFNLNERYEKTYAYALRIADRLESTPGYRVGDKVAIIGGFPSETYYPTTDVTAQVLRDYFGAGGDLVINSTDKYATFFSHYLNVTIVPVDNETEQALSVRQEYSEMEVFPQDGSIRRIDDVWVVRISE